MLLEEVMGKEYAESFSGQMYEAFLKIKKEASANKFKMLIKEIAALIPAEARDRIGTTTVYYKGYPIRQQKENAWFELPDFTSPSIHKITAQIMYIAPRNGGELIKLWQQDPRQFAWQMLDVYKLLDSIEE